MKDDCIPEPMSELDRARKALLQAQGELDVAQAKVEDAENRLRYRMASFSLFPAGADRLSSLKQAADGLHVAAQNASYAYSRWHDADEAVQKAMRG